MNRILIVSDNPFLRDMVRLSLSGLGADVRCAAKASELEPLCNRGLFDLVIVLCAAPFLGGRDMVAALRPPGLRKPKFYVVSWQQSEQTVMSLLESGVDQCLTFPINLQRLRSKVAGELNKML